MANDNSRRSNEARRRASMDSVLNAARHLFVAQGFGATTMDAIAKQAKLTKGAVYFYFKNKGELLIKLIEQSQEQLMMPIFASMRAADTSAAEQLVMYTNHLAQTSGEGELELLLLPILISLEFSGREDSIKKLIGNRYNIIYREIERVIVQGQQEGTICQTLPAQEQATVIVAMTEGLLLEWFRRGKSLDGRALAQISRRFMLQGLQAA